MPGQSGGAQVQNEGRRGRREGGCGNFAQTKAIMWLIEIYFDWMQIFTNFSVLHVQCSEIVYHAVKSCEKINKLRAFISQSLTF